MLNVFWFKLKDYKQALPMILGMTLLSLVLIAVFGMSFDGADQPDVWVVDRDGTNASLAYMESVEAYGGFDYKYGTYEEGFNAVSAGSAIALILVEEGFSEGLSKGDAQVIMVKSGEAIEQYTLEANLSGASRRVALEEAFISQAPSLLGDVGIEVDPESLRDDLRDQIDRYPIMTVISDTIDGSVATGYDSLKHSFIGFILFFSMFTMVFGIGSIIEEKECHVWQRQSVSPVSLAQVMGGNLLATYVMGMGQLLFLVLVSRFLFDMDWGGSLAALLLVLSAYVLSTTCLGLFMSGLVSTSQQLGSFSPIVVVSTSMLGGCMWPLEIITSQILLLLADITPQRWAYKGLKAVIIQNGGIGDVLDSLIILLVMALVFFILGMWPYVKKEVKTVVE